MKKKKRLTRDDLELMIMATPTLVWFLLFSFLPMLGVLIAFKNFHISGGGFINSFLNSPWVGFKNFEFLFSTNEAFTITRNTLLYNLCFIVLDVAVPGHICADAPRDPQPQGGQGVPDHSVPALFPVLGGGRQLPVRVFKPG